MPPRRPRPTPPDVDALRTALGQGKIVRVGIAPSDQFPDGVTGRVRRIGDPGIDGDEFLYVEVPVGGAKDVLPFAPKDLTSAPARKPVAPATALTPRQQPLRPVATPNPRLLPGPAVPLRTAGPVSPPPVAAASNASASGAPASVPTTAPVPPAPPGELAVSTPAPPVKLAGRAAPRGAAAGGRGKRASVTITISTAGDESAAWRIEARIGAKAAVRPTVIPPSRVWEIVQSLGEPKLTEVVQTLLEDHRRSTQARADALAAELSSLQAELNSFPGH